MPPIGPIYEQVTMYAVRSGHRKLLFHDEMKARFWCRRYGGAMTTEGMIRRNTDNTYYTLVLDDSDVVADVPQAAQAQFAAFESREILMKKLREQLETIPFDDVEREVLQDILRRGEMM